MDIDNIEPGVEFDQVIEKYLNSCEVMLVVIGPRWLGYREDRTARINDQSDWVRLEVSSALKRKIRVIPVLVDGASLPKEEELPEDLKTLLKRQSYELSNKRWQYDVDRLIDFLIRVAGIIPGRSRESHEQHLPSSKKLWIYSAAAFVIVVIATLLIVNLTKSKNDNSAPTSKLDTTQTSVTSSTTNISESATETVSHDKNNISGTWEEDDPGVKSNFILQQTGEHIKVKVQSMGQVLSEGEGTINGKNVELKFELLGSATVLKGNLSDDGNKISGTYTMQLTNDPQTIVLIRKK